MCKIPPNISESKFLKVLDYFVDIFESAFHFSNFEHAPREERSYKKNQVIETGYFTQSLKFGLLPQCNHLNLYP